jgi:hypothetical protein
MLRSVGCCTLIPVLAVVLPVLASATSIVGIRTSEVVVIAADSEGSFEGATTTKRQVCKIHPAGNLYFAVGGLVKDPPRGFDVEEIVGALAANSASIAAGDFTDDVRALYAPVVAELPHRVANDLFQRCTGVVLSSRGAQSIIDSTAQDLQRWQAACETHEAAALADALVSADGAADLRVEIAMDGVMAHIDGRWQEAKVATILVRRLEVQAEKPTLGTVLARRYIGILGAAEELAARITQVNREAGWERLPIGEILGDGASWIWKVADAHFPGVRQTLDYYHLSEHFYGFATLLYANDPAGAKAWVEQKMGALITDRVGEVLRGLKRMRPWKTVVCDALAQLIGYVERNRTRIRYQEPWHRGLAVGSGAVEAAYKQVIQSRFKRADMRWKQPGFLNVLALRIARLNATFQAFWASRGLVVQISG